MSCCPSFLLASAGSHLAIYGAVQTDKFIVQHLAHVHLGDATTYGDKKVYEIAKAFFSLRSALESLDKYYRSIKVPTSVVKLTPSSAPEDIALPSFFPYATQFKEFEATESIKSKEPAAAKPTDSQESRVAEVTKYTKFKYSDVPDADPTNVTFFAQVDSDPPGPKLVVKFVNRYGVKAHETLAEKRMAPQLLYYGTIDGNNDLRASGDEGRFEHGLYIGPLRMVVMEHIEGDSWPDDAKDQVKEAIDLLHQNNLVFGDLRPPNVLFSGGKVFLIDFDWAGKKNVARYPRNLSTGVEWAADARGLERELIKPEHDDKMLELLFTSA